MHDRVFFHRNAGSRVYHADAPRWVESGKAICGAVTGRAFVYRSGDPSKWQGAECEELVHYPRRYGKVRACRRCVARIETKGDHYATH